MRYIALFIFTLYQLSSYSQQSNSALEDAKFQIVRKTVWFYSKDTSAFKAKVDCDKSSDFAQLIDCASKLDGVVPKVKKWQSKPITSPSDLKALLDSIKSELTSNSKRAYRSKMPEYKLLISFSEDIIKNIDSQQATEIKDPINKAVNENESSDKSVKPTVDDTQGKEVAPNKFDWWNIGLLIFNLILFAYLFVRVNLLKQDFADFKQRNSSTGNEKSRGDNENLNNRLKKLESELKSFDESIDNLRDELNKKINRITNSNTTVTESTAQPLISQTKSDPIAETSKNTVVVKYAKWADEGDAFSASSLTDESGNEKIFEITLKSNSLATFRITSNRNAQLFALTNYDRYLGKTCKFDSVPSSNSSIVNTGDGELRLQGNRWLIVSPAKIRFE